MMNREEFINWLGGRLSPQFNRDGDVWKCVSKGQPQIHQIVINGKAQTIRQEGPEVELSVEIYGEGSVGEEEFVEINLDSLENGASRNVIPTLCIYYNEVEELDEIIKQVFGI